MRCPRCRQAIPLNPPRCGHCDFALAEIQRRLGSASAIIEPVMDVAGCLRLADSQRLAALVDDFEHRFPQVHLSLFIGVLPEMRVLEAGFWLLNHGTRQRQEELCDNRYGIIVLIDPTANEAGIAVGYALESLLNEELLLSLIKKNSHHLWHSDHSVALQGMIHGLDAALRRTGKPRPRGLAWKSVGPILGLQTVPQSEPHAHKLSHSER